MTSRSAFRLRLLALLFLLASPLSLGQIYSWVDENGNKHFGDKIPPEYQDQASEYEVPETNSAQAIEPQTRRQAISRPRQAPAREQTQNDSMPTQAAREPRTCEERKAAYAESTACFNSCRTGSSNNIANCGHCKQMKKPNC